MQLVKRADEGFALRHVTERELALLKRVPSEADPSGCPGAEERLFPDPMRFDDPELNLAPPDRAEAAFLDDWNEFVRPDLVGHFADALETFDSDVRRAAPEPTADAGVASAADAPRRFSIDVPADHAEQWFAALNQARLVMSEKHRLPESNSAAVFLELVKSRKLDAFLRARFYALLQEWIVAQFMK